MNIALREFRLFTRAISLRRPFKFGIVELRSLEHGVLACTFEIDGKPVEGYAGENLVPRWFSKNPALSIEEDIAMLRRGVKFAASRAVALGAADTPFDLWWQLHRSIRGDSPASIAPPLAAQLAESFVERAAIDAWCRHHDISLTTAMTRDRLGVRLAEVHRTLASIRISDCIAHDPATQLAVRHTVGLGDDPALLPVVLQGHGISRLKIKLSGDPAADCDRLIRVWDSSQDAGVIRITLDGNENYASVESLEAFIDRLERDATLAECAKCVAWIEQPLHRDVALSDDAGKLLRRRRTFPMVLDESDAGPDDLPRALDLGYMGTTHKSCKGIFKSIVHRATLAQFSSLTWEPTILSGEDLTIVAPWSQASDLAAAAAVGVVDVERNGHYYADGLRGLGDAVSDAALQHYPELYRRRADGTVDLRISDGHVHVPHVLPVAPLLHGFGEVT